MVSEGRNSKGQLTTRVARIQAQYTRKVKPTEPVGAAMDNFAAHTSW